MAKLKPAGKTKAKSGSPKNAVPCLLLIFLIMAFLLFLFYLVLQSGK